MGPGLWATGRAVHHARGVAPKVPSLFGRAGQNGRGREGQVLQRPFLRPKRTLRSVPPHVPSSKALPSTGENEEAGARLVVGTQGSNSCSPLGGRTEIPSSGRTAVRPTLLCRHGRHAREALRAAAVRAEASAAPATQPAETSPGPATLPARAAPVSVIAARAASEPTTAICAPVPTNTICVFVIPTTSVSAPAHEPHGARARAPNRGPAPSRGADGCRRAPCLAEQPAEKAS